MDGHGVRDDVGESTHCDRCDATFYEGQPVTVVARTCSDGRWDIEELFGPWCAPESLDEYRQRDGEGIALAEGEPTLEYDSRNWL